MLLPFDMSGDYGTSNRKFQPISCKPFVSSLLNLFFCMNRNLDRFITGEDKKRFSNVMDIFNDFF